MKCKKCNRTIRNPTAVEIHLLNHTLEDILVTLENRVVRYDT